MKLACKLERDRPVGGDADLEPQHRERGLEDVRRVRLVLDHEHAARAQARHRLGRGDGPRLGQRQRETDLGAVAGTATGDRDRPPVQLDEALDHREAESEATSRDRAPAAPA